jgi:arylsulfatase A-like enzyme
MRTTTNRRTFLRTLGTSALLAPSALTQPRNAAPPNIVLILADDLGYGDLGVYGSKLNRTPHLDRLAGEGVRFTDFHSNGPMCSPTRAALLTGRYQQRFGRAFESALGEDSYDSGLPAGAITIAQVLKERGYATAVYGKWHLGYRPPFLPPRYGFDDFRGLGSGDGDHHSHIDRSGRKDWWHNERIEMETGYTADLLTRHSIRFIEQNRNRPFFLYVPHLAIHFPWQGPRDKGYRVEGKDYNDLSKLGQLDSKDVSAKVKEMVEAVDESTGRIVAALQQHGLTENTLVVFTSDNGGYLTYQGGYHNISSNGPLRGQKTDVYEGGHRVPAIVRWPGRIRPGISDQTAMTFDLFPAFAQLAGASGRAASLKLDGSNLNPVLFDGKPLAARTLFWRMRDKKAVRQGDWKLVLAGKQEPELYNLRSDIGESRNLADSQPEMKSKLLRELARWEADVDGSR